MMTYKVLEAKKPSEAEKMMNDMAREGWVVKSVVEWTPSFIYKLIITFERENEE